MNRDTATGQERQMSTEQAKHTPWHVEQKRGLGPIVVGSNGQHIATVYVATQAGLIAAAPELLEALETLLRVHTEPKLNDEGPSYRAVKKARSAIAKATT